MATVSKVEPLVDALRTRILEGEFDGGRLPSFRQLGTEYETTQETMNKVMQALQAEGVLVSRGTKGVFVNNARIRMPGLVADFAKYLKSSGLTPKSILMDKPEIISPPEEVQKSMNLKKGEKVLCRHRKQGTEDSFFRITTEYYNMKFINESMLEKINNDPHFNIVHAIKDNFGKTIEFAEEEVIVRLPNRYEQQHLQIVRTNPVIESTSINFSEDKNEVILYFHKILNANQFTLTYNHKIKDWK